MRRWFGFVLVLALLGLLAGPATALTVQNTAIDWHIFNGDSASSIYTIQDEPSDFSDVTLFCPLDAMDTANNVTPCYLNGQIVNATIHFNESTGYPKLTSGRIGNAFEFDGNDGEKVNINTNVQTTSTREMSVVVSFRPSSLKNSIITALKKGGTWIASIEIGSGQVKVNVWCDESKKQNALSVPVEANVWYTIALTVNETTATAYLFSEGAEYTNTITLSNPNILHYNITNITLGAGVVPEGNVFDGVVDEFRVYDRVLTQDEIKLLYLAGRKKLSEPASLAVSSATYDSTANKFDITINASLPAGAQYIYVPADAIVNAPAVQNWSTGHKLIDVSGKNSILITIPAVIGTSLTGINMLAVETDEGLCAYGTGDHTLVNPLAAPISSPQVTNIVSDGKVIGLSLNGLSTFQKLQPSRYISGMAGSTDLTILSESADLLHLNLAPNGLTLYLNNLNPLIDYKISDGNSELGTFETDTLGMASISVPAGDIYLGTPENINDVMSNNLINLLTKIFIITIFAGIFVEMTKTKMDDEMVAAIIGLLVVMAIIVLIHYL